MIIMLQLCFICACLYDLLFMSYAACAISKYALCIVCFTLHVKLTKIIFLGVWDSLDAFTKRAWDLHVHIISNFLFG